MVEFFDILDENGNKTGKTKARAEVHRDGDWHKAVHIWIANNKDEILLQKRSPNKDSYPNMWDISSAGHLTAGDDSISEAIREIKEELNAEISIDKFVTTVEYDYPKFHLTMHCYLCSLTTDSLHLNEHEAAKWLTKEELDSVKWLPADLIVIENL